MVKKMGIRYSKRMSLIIILVNLLLLIVLLYFTKSDFNLSSDNNNGNIIISDKNDSDINGNLKSVEQTPNLKYILQWTSDRTVPFVYMGQGQSGFIDRKCPHTNCYVTHDRKYLGDIKKFDVIAFANPEVNRITLPVERSTHQKFVFATIESSDYYPVCSNKFDGYFNWTWTFRLESEVRWGYFNIWDKKGNIVGPNKIMDWIKHEDMDPISEQFKEQLKSKSIAAAWFVSNCRSKSKRENVAKELQEELKKYNLSLDVYGNCGSKKCPRNEENKCFKMVQDKYYFYLSFENSFSEDYVTEKLLTALKNDAIPIVYGDVNYTRFMPPGIYLDARKLGVKDLAATMDRLIKNPEEYAEYFRWKNHYTYQRKSESVLTDEYCLFCAILNDEHKVKETSVYRDFKKWWNPPGRC